MSMSTPILCLSHLRWDFVFQRPHHLMTRFARDRQVFFIEEPVFGAAQLHHRVTRRQGGVRVVVPHLPVADNGGPLTQESIDMLQRELLDDLLAREELHEYVLWYYTPVALRFSRHLDPRCVVYDCMDELAAFALPPPMLPELEHDLFERADVVFTGGRSLYEMKSRQHPAVYCFPSGVDVRHFRKAREPQPDPADQAHIGRPRIGFAGVLDERIDLQLLSGIARVRPDWNLVVVGPVAEGKLDPAALPCLPNIHYLGGKPYDSLPRYIAGWDAAMLPFTRSAATRYISPTKTPEYLAAGKRVVSTSIQDVVSPYGERGLVAIADSVPDFVAALDAALPAASGSWLQRVDSHLALMSWDTTWGQMRDLVEASIRGHSEQSGQRPASGIAAVAGAAAE